MKKKIENSYFIFDRPYDISPKEIIKRIYNYLMTFVYSLLMKFCRITPHEKKYNVSVCAIFKNEANYLEEWLEFNHIIGVEHFYLYNNKSEDDYMKILAPYIAEGIVTLIDWPYNQMQMEAYIDCINSFSNETKWLGFIDIDEFIVPKETDTIYDFLKKYNNMGAVKIYWRLYGTSGYYTRDLSGLVVEDFKVCWPKYCDIGKCFYNTSYGFDYKSKKKGLHHCFWSNWKGINIPPINVFGHVCVGDINRVDSNDFPIQINHYFTKSKDEYIQKKNKGDVYFKINPHDEEYFYRHEMKCTSVDYSAFKYLIKLKEQLRKRDSV